MSQLGPIPIPFQSWDEVPNNPFYAPNAQIVPELEAYMDQLRRDGDFIGARIELVAENPPAGWGEPLYDRLDADIAHVMMGLNAVKGVSRGAGFDCIAPRGYIGRAHAELQSLMRTSYAVFCLTKTT